MPDGVSNTKFSLIHVEDAAKAIEKVLDGGTSVHNQAINLAFNKDFTLRKLLRDIANQFDVGDLEFLSEDDATWYSYPTVTKGPRDISRSFWTGSQRLGKKPLLNFALFLRGP